MALLNTITMDLINLPENIIINIFTYLSSVDLNSLAIVCKHLNEIITTSSRVTKAFKLFFLPENASREWINTRKISKVYIDGSVASSFIYILADISPQIQELEIDCCEIELMLIKQIVLICENLKSLALVEVENTLYESTVIRKPLPRLNLKYLYFEGAIDVFAMFQNCTAENAEILFCRQISNSKVSN